MEWYQEHTYFQSVKNENVDVVEAEFQDEYQIQNVDVVAEVEPTIVTEEPTEEPKVLKRKVKRKPRDKEIKVQDNKNIDKKKFVKRQRHDDKTIDYVAKKMRAQGKEGTGRNGPIAERKMKPGCADRKCRFNCSKKISDDDRKIIFQQFWDLGDKTKQWICLNNWVLQKKSGLSSGDEARGKVEKTQHVFQLPTNKGPISVCRTHFLATLDISYQWVRTAQLKKKRANFTGILEVDQRGKHKNRPHKYPEGMKNKVRKHIQSFPLMPSDKGDGKKFFDQEDLTLSKMYRMYVEQTGKTEDDPTVVSYNMYDTIFKNEFDIEFRNKN